MIEYEEGCRILRRHAVLCTCEAVIGVRTDLCIGPCRALLVGMCAGLKCSRST